MTSYISNLSKLTKIQIVPEKCIYSKNSLITQENELPPKNNRAPNLERLYKGAVSRYRYYSNNGLSKFIVTRSDFIPEYKYIIRFKDFKYDNNDDTERSLIVFSGHSVLMKNFDNTYIQKDVEYCYTYQHSNVFRLAGIYDSLFNITKIIRRKNKDEYAYRISIYPGFSSFLVPLSTGIYIRGTPIRV
jgi:hypothetical protein